MCPRGKKPTFCKHGGLPALSRTTSLPGVISHQFGAWSLLSLLLLRDGYVSSRMVHPCVHLTTQYTTHLIVTLHRTDCSPSSRHYRSTTSTSDTMSPECEKTDVAGKRYLDGHRLNAVYLLTLHAPSYQRTRRRRRTISCSNSSRSSKSITTSTQQGYRRQ